MLFNCNNLASLLGCCYYKLSVDRLDSADVNNFCADTVSCELLSSFKSSSYSDTSCYNTNICTLSKYSTFSKFKLRVEFYSKAVAKGQTLKSAEFKWYRINDAGQEVEYFNMFLENVKVVSVCPLMHDVKNPATEKHNHLESVSLRYERITWKHCDGNIIFSDEWNER